MNIERKVFSINFNAQHVNGMTSYDLAVLSGKLVELDVRLLDTLE